jgi:hypothetical protein
MSALRTAMQQAGMQHIDFDLDAIKSALLPILIAKREAAHTNSPASSLCKQVDGQYCCLHVVNTYFPPRTIISCTDISEIRRYALFTAAARTTCVQFEIRQALLNNGIFFSYTEYELWQELLRLGQFEDALALEYAICQKYNSAHPKFVGPNFDKVRLDAHKKYIVDEIKSIWGIQDLQDQLADEEYDKQFNEAIHSHLCLPQDSQERIAGDSIISDLILGPVTILERPELTIDTINLQQYSINPPPELKQSVSLPALNKLSLNTLNWNSSDSSSEETLSADTDEVDEIDWEDDQHLEPLVHVFGDNYTPYHTPPESPITVEL